MTKELPAQPNISQLRRQARDLQRAVISGEVEGISRVRHAHPAPPKAFAGFTLRDAQLTVAREYGFEGWNELSTAVGEMMVDVRDLDRWFGVELNNEVWSRIDASAVGPDSPLAEREHLLYTAYASALHWRNAGTVANVARAEHLISRAATAVGMLETALGHAERCHELVVDNPDEVEDWDLAFALEALARAQAGSGDLPAAAETKRAAVEACRAVAEDEDRVIVEGELAREPWFGLV